MPRHRHSDSYCGSALKRVSGGKNNSRHLQTIESQAAKLTMSMPVRDRSRKGREGQGQSIQKRIVSASSSKPETESCVGSNQDLTMATAVLMPIAGANINDTETSFFLGTAILVKVYREKHANPAKAYKYS
ncbi:uncharacterized protein TRIVIDRAFT_200925 [Trichoderma virens Gv29-8]|uniref:Uncharacterized protein n=1 Tax=Hypocrea virens (strain Gv29-8 / FGSC 10586) TaxID=413071 RepID=G9MRA7_HYPVG|nr:uncharacterized protein TRIVIDRAFT_200925 [Trichoderma virens Gv29-8]EHK22631.1 hypothetical protein TRIVIDRAFT_200925 [Trichoderma virens Gv29-8]UKZ47682.1 hypothetical protein TrVGV298_001908 [Trichoderma virens]